MKPSPKILLVLAALILGAFPARAQDEFPQAIDPATVFTDAVEVVDKLPLVSWDRQQIGFYDYQTQRWKTYPYPQEVQPLDWEVDFERLDNGRYIINFFGGYADGILEPSYPVYESEPADVWYFNPITGEFSRPETGCKRFYRTERPYWVTYRADTTNQLYLCNTATKELSKPLHLDLEPFYPTVVSLSKDGNKAAIPDQSGVYIYDFVTGQVEKLSEITDAMYARFIWIDDRHIVIRNNTPIENSDQYLYRLYTVDVTQPNSVKLIYSSTADPYQPYYARDIEWVGSGKESENPNDEVCTVYSYSLETAELTSYRVPEVCGLSRSIPDGSGDYLYLASVDTLHAKLIRFNPQSGKKRDLFAGRIEAVDQFSPNGKYVALIMNNETGQHMVAILDMSKGIFVYESPFSTDVKYFQGNVEWLDDDTFLLNNADADLLVSFKEMPPQETLIGRAYDIHYDTSSDKQLLLLWRDETTLAMFNRANGTITPIAKRPEGYRIYASWGKDHALYIKIELADSNITVGNWRIRIKT